MGETTVLVSYAAVLCLVTQRSSARSWGGALRDETKNGCVGDYHCPGMWNVHFREEITVLACEMFTSGERLLSWHEKCSLPFLIRDSKTSLTWVESREMKPNYLRLWAKVRINQFFGRIFVGTSEGYLQARGYWQKFYRIVNGLALETNRQTPVSLSWHRNSKCVLQTDLVHKPAERDWRLQSPDTRPPKREQQTTRSYQVAGERYLRAEERDSRKRRNHSR